MGGTSQQLKSFDMRNILKTLIVHVQYLNNTVAPIALQLAFKDQITRVNRVKVKVKVIHRPGPHV